MMDLKKMRDLTTRRFLLTLTMLIFAYLGFEAWFNQYAMISVDEFWFAHRIFQYQDGIPYRDFSPYKTVLGYYLLLPPLSFPTNFISTLIITKDFIAIINASILFAAAIWLTRHFTRLSVIASLVALLLMDITLSYSTNIRVDLLAYWFCLFAFLCLLDSRFILAGLLLGLGFTTSQKSIWYWFACNTALSIHWLMTERNYRYFFNIVKFNLTIVGVILSYLILWSSIAGWHVVLNSVFVEASAMYHLDWYDASRLVYWRVILTLNPLAFLLWPLALFSLSITHSEDTSYPARRLVSVFAITIIMCLLPYKQVFPYYMQVTLPAFILLYAAFFDWLIKLTTRAPLQWLIHENIGSAFLILYMVTVSFVVWKFELPSAYMLINLLPLILFLRLYQSLSHHTFNLLLTLNLTFIGVIYPLAVYTQKLLTLNSRYQKANLTAMQVLLKDGSDYAAGIELIYNKTQPIAGLRHLMGPAISYLYVPAEKLRPVMTASLYEDPSVTPTSINDALLHSQVKFYINNYRMHSLPPTISHYLATHYQHLWGSIYFYAPLIAKGRQQTNLQFNGKYRVEVNTDNPVTINGRPYVHNEMIELAATQIITEAASSFRLALIPDDNELNLDPAFKDDQWERMLF